MAQIGADVLANAKKHWREKLLDSMQMVRVDEWDVDIFWKPSTLSQRNKVFKYLSENSLEGLAECLIQRSLDSEGKKIFNQASKKDLMTMVDPDVLIRIVTDMNEDSETTIEEARKNSD